MHETWPILILWCCWLATKKTWKTNAKWHLKRQKRSQKRTVHFQQYSVSSSHSSFIDYFRLSFLSIVVEEQQMSSTLTVLCRTHFYWNFCQNVHSFLLRIELRCWCNHIIINYDFMLCSGENVEEAFLKTAQIIFQSIQNGRYLSSTFQFSLSLTLIHTHTHTHSLSLFFLCLFFFLEELLWLNFVFHFSLGVVPSESGGGMTTTGATGTTTNSTLSLTPQQNNECRCWLDSRITRTHTNTTFLSSSLSLYIFIVYIKIDKNYKLKLALLGYHHKTFLFHIQTNSRTNSSISLHNFVDWNGTNDFQRRLWV